MSRSVSNRTRRPKAETFGHLNLRGEIETFTSIKRYQYVTLVVGQFGHYEERRKHYTLADAQTRARRNRAKGMETVIHKVLPKAEFGQFAADAEPLKQAAKVFERQQRNALAESAAKIAIRRNIRPFIGR